MGLREAIYEEAKQRPEGHQPGARDGVGIRRPLSAGPPPQPCKSQVLASGPCAGREDGCLPAMKGDGDRWSANSISREEPTACAEMRPSPAPGHREGARPPWPAQGRPGERGSHGDASRATWEPPRGSIFTAAPRASEASFPGDLRRESHVM